VRGLKFPSCGGVGSRSEVGVVKQTAGICPLLML